MAIKESEVALVRAHPAFEEVEEEAPIGGGDMFGGGDADGDY